MVAIKADAKDESYCFICGNRRKLDKEFELPGMIFNELEGKPFICSKCLFERIVGQPARWNEEFIGEYRKFFNV